MKKQALFVFLVLLAFAATTVASEVAEVAKKERARRQAFEKEGKMSKTFTNQDIANLKSTLAFEVSQPEPEEPREITTLPAADRPAETTEQAPRDEEREQELQQLKEEREALEQQARDAQQTINQGGGYHTRNLGNQYKTKREAESRIREIDEKMTEEKEEEQ